MTKAALRTDVFRRLAEVGPEPVFWTVEDVDEAIAAGYAELSDATEWYEQTASLDLLANRPYYDLFTILGPSFLAVRPIKDAQLARWLQSTHVRALDAHDRRWERHVGPPHRAFLRGLRWLGLSPRVPADRGQVSVRYVALPPPLVEEDDEPGFPEPFHAGIADWALSDLWAQDAETAAALAAWQDYLAVEAGLAAWVTHRASVPMTSGFGWAR
jgi:hypothetical protein